MREEEGGTTLPLHLVQVTWSGQQQSQHVRAENTHCNICNAKFKAGNGNTSNLRKLLIKHKIHKSRSL